MKSTNTVVLITSVFMFSVWGWGITQAAEPSLGSSFRDFCLQKESLSAETIKTVEVLLEAAGTNVARVLF
ncbi:MAG: hypothetical protein RIM23_28050 [Coleofasciculus sp. G3-WIS-01]|uniref:hypothetical protein n=1 Tax=Coleofasciculus sp. G3-WIS-01 TaxID=3069528 RepID=UPI0033038177